LFGGYLVKFLYDGKAIYALVSAGVILVVAAVFVIFVDDKDDEVLIKI
jgi:maltose/moltooligosaccharide transporter